MAVGPADVPAGRPRPRPSPATTSAGTTSLGEGERRAHDTQPSNASDGRRRGAGPVRVRPNRRFGRIDPAQPAQVVAAAGGAVVTAARVGRLLGRSGWRIAKQLPGVTNVESGAQRLRQVAATELTRLLDVPQHSGGTATAEEQRVMRLVQDAHADPEPLRTAMSELLARSAEADGAQSREYLFGTIISQLVPDEARVLAALATGRSFAAVDVLAKHGSRGRARPVLSHISTLAPAAGLSLPHNAPTYLTRLQGFGLVDVTDHTGGLDAQFESLLSDPAVRDARAGIEAGRQGNVEIVRKAITLSPLGREFWTACAPARAGPDRRHG